MRIFSKSNLPKTLLVALVSAVTVLSMVSPALAAQTASVQSITISPTSTTPTVDPGSSKAGSVKVLNGGTDPITADLSVTPYRVTGEDYDQSFTALPGAPNVTDWIKLAKTSTEIAGNSQQDIDYTINVPAGTQAGGYYAVVFAQTKAAPAPKTGVVVNQRVGTIFYITVSGDVKTEGHVLTWKTAGLQKPPLSAALRVSNTGNNHFPVKLTATVKDIFGRTKYTQETTKEVLPQTIRNIGISWAGTPPVGIVKVGGTIEYLGQTQTLPSHYVLVASTTVRLAALLFVVAVIVWFATAKQRTSKKSKKRK